MSDVKKGAGNPRARLTEAAVLAIRADPRTNREVAEAFGVSKTTVSYVRNGQTWHHLGGAATKNRKVLEAERTHCTRGHTLSGDNLKTDGKRRRCRACAAMHTAEWRKRNPGRRVPQQRRGGIPVDDRLWARVTIAGPDDCWVWTGHCTEHGYGRIGDAEGRARATHRLAYESRVGPIPEGMVVCHRCDNPPCCNPAHLFLGTVRDNVHDCIAKGRARWQKMEASNAG